MFQGDSLREDEIFYFRQLIKDEAALNFLLLTSAETGSGGSVTTAGIVVGIIIPLVIVACVCYACVYRRRQARRAQQQGTVAHVTQYHHKK